MKLFGKKAGAAPDLPWSGDMYPEPCGEGPRLNYPLSSYSSYAIRWVSREKGADGAPLKVRTPVESTKAFSLSGGFTAAGRHYNSLEQLYVEHDSTKTWCRDCYGREVLYLAERFPCFDSCDFENEDRFYRWFFLRQNDRLTRIHHTDTTRKIYVTEDVGSIERSMWSLMSMFGYFKEGKGHGV